MKKLVLFAVVLLIGCDSPKQSSIGNKPAHYNIDSLCKAIKRDSVFNVKDVYYNKNDSSLNIALAKNDELYNTAYFDSTYNIDAIDPIDGVTLYTYKKGRSFSKGDYKIKLATDSKRATELLKIFRDKYCIGNEYCDPLKQYIKQSMNDPDSFESDKMWIDWKEEKTFTVTMTYRGKNVFGGLILNKCSADVDIDGDVSNFQELD